MKMAQYAPAYLLSSGGIDSGFLGKMLPVSIQKTALNRNEMEAEFQRG
jgi:hypothetical protein